MNPLRYSPAAEPVRRFLLRRISQCGDVPEKIPSERELAGMLGISRASVRHAIAELEQNDFLIRLPGHNGAYANPRYSAVVDHCIGIAVHQNFLNSLTARMLGEVSGELSRRGAIFCFNLYHVPEELNEEVLAGLKNSGFDALIWVINYDEEFEAVRYLQERNFPVICIVYGTLPGVKPQDNVYDFDIEDAGKVMAEYLLSRNCRKLLYFGNDQGKADAFLAEAVRRGAKGEVLPAAPGMMEALPRLVARGAVDGIASSASKAWTTEMLDIIQKAAPEKRPVIFLQPTTFSDRAKEVYPELDITCADFSFLLGQWAVLGKRVGSDIFDLLAGKGRKHSGVRFKYYALPKER